MKLTDAEIAEHARALTPGERMCIDWLQQGRFRRSAPLPTTLFDRGYVERDEDGTPFLTFLGTQVGIVLRKSGDHGGMTA